MPPPPPRTQDVSLWHHLESGSTVRRHAALETSKHSIIAPSLRLHCHCTILKRGSSFSGKSRPSRAAKTPMSETSQSPYTWKPMRTQYQHCKDFLPSRRDQLMTNLTSSEKVSLYPVESCSCIPVSHSIPTYNRKAMLNLATQLHRRLNPRPLRYSLAFLM